MNYFWRSVFFLGFITLAAGLDLGAADDPSTFPKADAHAPVRPHRDDYGAMMRGTHHEAQSDNWSGYVVSKYQTGQSYTAIQGSWTVPTPLSSTAANARSWEYSASWIGIGGSCEDAKCVNSDSTLIQTGTEQDVYSTGSTQYYAWYELLPANSVTIPYAVNPGDVITASIVCTASCSSATQTWTIAMSDSTAGWSWSKTVSYASSLLSADWIQEATAICTHANNCSTAALDDFGQITFSQSTANGLNPNLLLSADAIQLTDTYGQTANPSAPSGGDAFTVCWGESSFTPCTYSPGVSPLVAAVLPASRSVLVNGTATVFATIINSGSSTATGCGVAPASDFTPTMSFQATNATTNAAAGAVNATTTIPAGASQSFLVSVTPGSTVSASNAGFLFGCANANPAPIVTGLDTLLLSASASATADIVALAATSNNDGILHIPGSAGSAAFAVATVNLGVAATITAKPSISTTLPLSLTICQTTPATGQCLQTPAASVQATITANATPTFAVFATATGSVPFLPGKNRIFVQFSDATAVRGSTSVAVQTQ
jgi:hypothetical protein